MKVHFILPHVNTYSYPDVHLGLASISSVLKSRGHKVSLHYITKKPSRKQILDVVQMERPDLIGFSAGANQIQYADEWSSWIKEEFDTPTICGGIHATLYPDEVISFSGIDALCRGEGEFPMLELIEDLQCTDIGNLWVKKGNTIIKNPIRQLISCLDDLPFPDYDLFDCCKILKDRRGDFVIIASRGCPFSCTFCCNHALKKVYEGKGRYFRAFTVDSLLKHLKLLKNKYPISRWTFADDLFGLDRKWVLEFCEKYPRVFDLEFECNARAENIDEELLGKLQSAHCSQIDMGIEVGNEWLRKEILLKNLSNEQIIKAFESAHKFGIKTSAYNMVGLPYETPEMIEETISLNRRVAPDQVGIHVFYPFPGTRLREVCKTEGFLSTRRTTSFMTESVLNLPTLPKKELDRLYIKFYVYVINRRIQWYPRLFRSLLRLLVFITVKIFGKRAIDILLKIYSSFIRMFSLFEAKRRHK
jgi:anaerobic magnesium-protoporphyrin IX monomethyl ester cyclase